MPNPRSQADETQSGWPMYLPGAGNWEPGPGRTNIRNPRTTGFGGGGGSGPASGSGGGWPGTPITEPLYPGGLPQGAWNLPTAPASGGLPDMLRRLGFSADDLVRLGVAGGAAALGGGGDDVPPELRQILDLQRQRLLAGNPLYESVLRLAFSRLPTEATQGLSIPPIGG